MDVQKEDKIESDMSEDDIEKQDDALKEWTKEKKKSEKTPSVISEVVSGVIDIISGI